MRKWQWHLKNPLTAKGAARKKTRFTALAAGALFSTCVLIGFVNSNLNAPEELSKEIPIDLNFKHKQAQKAAPAPPKAAKLPKNAEIPLDIAKENPFVGKADLQAQEKSASPAPSVADNLGAALPLPSVPAPPILTAPTDQAGARSSSAVQGAAVQGVIIGNSGDNMAILSNGSLVQEGDEFMQSRIAAIGQDGIRLENGQKISYGIRP